MRRFPTRGRDGSDQWRLPATAESPAERGLYLVSTIMACGNCHTPRDVDGRPLDKALSGGLTFTTPAFVATAPNITGDVETGIGGWSDAEIKRALVLGTAARSRPPRRRAAGGIMPASFYKALLPNDLDAIVAYLRTVKPVRNEVPAAVSKAAVAAIRILMRRPASTRRRLPIRSSAAPTRHHRPLHGVPFRAAARRLGFHHRIGPGRPALPAARGNA
jgi:mono/diheme cytochrome c family protein